MNEIIHKNFPINILPWIGEQNDEYFCIIDGLNFMDGGAKRGIEDILVNNLIKLLDQIYPYDRRKRPVKIIVTYRGHIEHSAARSHIEKHVNNIINLAQWYDIIIDIIYVHTSIVDRSTYYPYTGGKKKKTTRKHRGIIQTGENSGRLRKGYKYSGQKTKTGLSIIIQTKTKNK